MKYNVTIKASIEGSKADFGFDEDDSVIEVAAVIEKQLTEGEIILDDLDVTNITVTPND